MLSKKYIILLISICILFIPMDIISFQATSDILQSVNLKVSVKDENLDNVNTAEISCNNIHTGNRYDLLWIQSNERYEANVIPGTYQVNIKAEGYFPQEKSVMIYNLTRENDNIPQLIICDTLESDGKVNVHVTFEGEGLKNAEVHLYGESGIHLLKTTNTDGYANVSGPEYEDFHIIVKSVGKLTHSNNFTLTGTMDLDVTLIAEPSELVGSYRALGFVKADSTYVPGLKVTVWDRNNKHLVPTGIVDDGALSLPLYSSIFDMVIEAEGYETLVVEGIDLVNNTYYSPLDDSFEVEEIETAEQKWTTIDLSSDIDNPVITTLWSLDSNSRIFGPFNDFGTPRMQVGGPSFTADWNTVDTYEVDLVRKELLKSGPSYLSTVDFLRVNSGHYDVDVDSYRVEVNGLSGNSFETGVNPVVIMNATYGSEIGLDIGYDDITVEVLTILDDETVVVKVPSNYEILNNFGDKAEFSHNTSTLMIYEPIEFTAKVKEPPVASLYFQNSYNYFRVDTKKYIVRVDENITLSAKNSMDPVGYINKYIWGNLPENIIVWDEEMKVFLDKMDLDLVTMENITFQFTGNSHTYHNITLQVQDSSDLISNIDWIALLPDSQPPSIEDYTVILTGTNDLLQSHSGNYQVDEDLMLEFNASSAWDNGIIVDYIWTYSDNSQSANGMTTQHKFFDPGIYNISLKIVDAVGNELEVENRTVTVNDMTDPMAVIKPLGDVNQGELVELNGTQSFDPRSTGYLFDAIIEYQWTFEYDNVTRTLYGDVAEFCFDIPGEYTINLTVKDQTNLIGWVEKKLIVRGADLAIRDFSFSNPDENNMNEGDRTKITIVIENDGFVDCPGNWTIRVTDNGRVIKTATIVNTISPGELYYFNFSYELKQGEREFTVFLDYDEKGGVGVVPEQNEDNNEFLTVIEVDAPTFLFYWWYILIILIIPIVMIIVIILIIISIYLVLRKKNDMKSVKNKSSVPIENEKAKLVTEKKVKNDLKRSNEMDLMSKGISNFEKEKKTESETSLRSTLAIELGKTNKAKKGAGSVTIEKLESKGPFIEKKSVPTSKIQGEYQLGNYKIISTIGSGGFSKVYLAEKEGIKYAIKIPSGLKDSSDVRKAFKGFLREAKNWEKVYRDPVMRKYVVGIYSYGTDPEPFIVMEYMDRGNLKRELHRMKFDQKLEFIKWLLDALYYVHHTGVIHRDLKPENILLNSKGEWKIADWGLSKVLLESSIDQTKAGSIKGTLSYAAPEQIDQKRFGRIDWRTDIYQSGVLAYTLLTGRRPYKGDSISLLYNIINTEPVHPSKLNSRISKNMGDAILKAMDKDKKNRWKDAIEFKNELDKIDPI